MQTTYSPRLWPERVSSCLLLLILLLSTSSWSAAATWYVSTTGNDNTGDGSSAKPFASLQRAGWAATPGDVILVQAGTYYPQVQQSIGYRGDFGGKRVVIKPNGGKVIFDGSQVQGESYALHTILPGDNVEFRGFEVRNSKSIGIFLYDGGRNTIIADNDVHDSYDTGIRQDGSTGSANNLIIDNNRVHDNGVFNRKENRPNRDNLEGFPPGITFGRGTNIRVTNNEVYRNQGEGILSFGQGSSAYVAGNRVYDNYSVELYLANVTGTTIERNFIYTTGDQRSYRYNLPANGILIANEEEGGSDQSGDNVIKNNIVIGSRIGFYYGQFEAGGGLRNTVIANNTFYDNAETPIRIDNGSHTGSRIVNNIFRARSGTELAKIYSTSGVSFDHNLWSGGDGNKDSGGSSSDVNAAPLFVSAGTLTPESYKLQSTSPAINKGASVTGVTIDFANVTRPQGGSYDIGAYEYVGTTSGTYLQVGAVYELVPQCCTSQRLDVAGGTGPNVQIYAANNLNPQRWKIINKDAANNIYKFEPQSQIGKRLDANNGVTIATAIDQPHQNWKLYPVDVANSIFELEPQSSLGNRLDVVTNANGSKGPDVQVYSNNTGNGQNWKLVKISSARLSAEEVTVAESGQLSVYPNPAQSEVTLESAEELVSVKLVNSLGRVHLHKTGLNSRKASLSVSHLTQGLYLIQAKTSSGAIVTKRITISR